MNKRNLEINRYRGLLSVSKDDVAAVKTGTADVTAVARLAATGQLPQGAILKNMDLTNVNLSNVKVQGADLSGAKLGRATNMQARGAKLSHTKAQDSLDGADLTESHGTGFEILGSANNITMAGAVHYSLQAVGAPMKYADLKNSMFAGCNFASSDMSNANADDAALVFCNMNDSYANSASFNRTDLSWSSANRSTAAGATIKTDQNFSSMAGMNLDHTKLNGDFAAKALAMNATVKGIESVGEVNLAPLTAAERPQAIRKIRPTVQALAA